MTMLPGHVLEPLRTGHETSLFRARSSTSSDQTVLVAITATPNCSDSGRRRLKHEFSFASDLDDRWAARWTDLSEVHGRAVLWLSDGGGALLQSALSRPMSTERFLRLAIALACSSGEVRRTGLLHNDVNPANILVVDTAAVWLTGFWIARQTAASPQVPSPPKEISGTLAYMAPEQTGLVSRSIDSRGDLLSKAPEERYQTAAGLEAGLRLCLAALQSSTLSDELTVGTRDVRDRLMPPAQLHGRTQITPNFAHRGTLGCQ